MTTRVSPSFALVGLGVALSVLLGACAGTPPPTQQMALAEAAVKRANTSSTAENAAGELQIAKSKLASAQQAETSKNYERARQLAEEAQVDAQVAELRAQSARSRKAADESQNAARVLQEELNRKTTR
jgi:hypothetical protein